MSSIEVSEVVSAQEALAGFAPRCWFVDDTVPREFDPVRDIRILEPGEARYTPELIDTVVSNALAAISYLQHLDPTELDHDTLTAAARGIEQIRRSGRRRVHVARRARRRRRRRGP